MGGQLLGRCLLRWQRSVIDSVRRARCGAVAMPMYKVRPFHGAPGAVRAEQLPTCMYPMQNLHRGPAAAAPLHQVGAEREQGS